MVNTLNLQLARALCAAKVEGDKLEINRLFERRLRNTTYLANRLEYIETFNSLVKGTGVAPFELNFISESCIAQRKTYQEEQVIFQEP